MLEIYLSYFPEYVYTASKFLAYVLLCLFYLLIAGLLFSFTLLSNYALIWQMWAGLYTIFLISAIFIGVNLLFCTLLDSAPLALLSTIFIYASSQMASQAVKIIALSQSAALKGFFQFLYYLLPNLDKMDIKYLLMYGEPVHTAFFAAIFAYSLIYCLFLWAVSTLAFSRR